MISQKNSPVKFLLIIANLHIKKLLQQNKKYDNLRNSKYILCLNINN